VQTDPTLFPARHRWAAALLLGLAGLLLNLQPFPMSPGIRGNRVSSMRMPTVKPY